MSDQSPISPTPQQSVPTPPQPTTKPIEFDEDCQAEIVYTSTRESQKSDIFKILVILIWVTFIIFSIYLFNKVSNLRQEFNSLREEKKGVDEMQSEILRFYVNDGLVNGTLTLITNINTKNIHLTRIINVPSNTNSPVTVDGKTIKN